MIGLLFAASICTHLMAGGCLLEIRDGSGADASETFAMGPGGCLRGPLQFFDRDRAIVFELAPNADYPAGCSRGN